MNIRFDDTKLASQEPLLPYRVDTLRPRYSAPSLATGMTRLGTVFPEPERIGGFSEERVDLETLNIIMKF